MMPGHGIDLVVAVDLECGYLAKVFFSGAVGRHTKPLKRIIIESGRTRR